MNLKEIYIELCSNSSFYTNYHSIGKDASGNMFSFFGTNRRSLLTKRGENYNGFAKSFNVIKEVVGVKRSDWILNPTRVNQERQKQHTVIMRKSEFFRVVNDAYELTSRGVVFEKMLQQEELLENEKKLLCLILILSGYFDDVPNYLIERVSYIFEQWNDAGYSDEEILSFIEAFVAASQGEDFEKKDIFKYDYLFLDSFFEPFNDINFLKLYKNSTYTEKEELVNYITYNLSYNCANMNNKCLLSYKYKNGGNFVLNTLVDNALIVYVVKSLLDNPMIDFDRFINTVVNSYKKLFSINEVNIRKFIYDTDKNRSVFQVIFAKLSNTPIPILEVANDLTIEEINSIGQIDTTDEVGQQQLFQVTGSLKKIAKLNSDYKCVLHDCEMCTYFTAKENHKNYLEIHHFIPREFANDFDESIEILENYVVLCPKCHRKIHLAEDNERKHMINILFNIRNSSLESKGLKVDLNQLYRYYNIET